MINQSRYAPVAWWKHLVAAAIGFSVISAASALAAPWAYALRTTTIELWLENPSGLTDTLRFAAYILTEHCIWLADSFGEVWRIPLIFGFYTGPILLAVSIWPRGLINRRMALLVVVVVNASAWYIFIGFAEIMIQPEGSPLVWAPTTLALRIFLACIAFGLGYMAVLRLLFLRPPPPIEETFD